ncbi:GMC oxidoreductase domain-containing protein [Phthorimaea operculella]|nr:GMC oxidoreductase domain-containing protein [Phthorimaea operculella]
MVSASSFHFLLLLYLWPPAAPTPDLFSKATRTRKDELDIRNSVFDFIIVGGGTAGCLLANRLSAVPEWKVLLLEAGEEENIDYDIPGVPTKDYRPILWNYRTERNGFSCLSRPGGSCEVRTGKVLGGSSVTNDMKYTRGTKADYDSWHKNGEISSIDWKFGNLLEFFKHSEDNGDYDILMNSHYHSRGGEMRVQRFKYADRYLEVFTSAFTEMGLRSLDANINAPEAIVNHQFALQNNTRLSTNSAFLKPVRHRKNLAVVTGATVTKIVIDRLEKTVDGVIYEFDKGKERPAYAKREIILTGGAINNVKLLYMSGIGPKAELKKFNITTLMDLPSRSGPLASRGINQISAFIQLYEQNNAPDVEIAFEGNFVRSDKFMLTNVSVHAAEESNMPLAYYNLINVIPIVLRPKSKGKVTLNKRNPKYGRPVITANLLKEPEDLETLVDAIDISLQLLDKKEVKKAEVKFAPIDLFPCDRLRSRDQWNCIARHYTKAVGNPIGTCRMGDNATNSVVDFELRVHGIEGLRIVDASVMPTHVRGGIFAPTLMIAEKAAKMITKDWKEDKGFYFNRR